MKKAQVLKFWKKVNDSTYAQDVISELANKLGYAGKRTLQRFVQAQQGFRLGQTLEEISKKTGWSIAYVDKIKGWWTEEFSLDILRTEIVPESTKENHGIESDTIGGSGDCVSSPDEMTLDHLIKLGVPKSKSPHVIYEWRQHHLEGKHNLCACYPKLFKDVQNGIPFVNAHAILQMEIRGNMFHLESAIAHAEIARIYRPWENRDNYDALFKEIESRRKADPNYVARMNHIGEVRGILFKFGEQIKRSIDSQRIDNKLEIENTDSFEFLLHHDSEVYWQYGQLYHKRLELSMAKDRFCKKVRIDIPSSTKKILVRCIVDSIIQNAKSPSFKITKDNSNWRLFIIINSEEIKIAQGNEDEIIYYQDYYCKLVTKFKKDNEVKNILKIQREMISIMRKIARQIEKVISSDDFLHTHCFKCPQLSI